MDSDLPGNEQNRLQGRDSPVLDPATLQALNVLPTVAPFRAWRDSKGEGFVHLFQNGLLRRQSCRTWLQHRRDSTM